VENAISRVKGTELTKAIFREPQEFYEITGEKLQRPHSFRVDIQRFLARRVWSSFKS